MKKRVFVMNYMNRDKILSTLMKGLNSYKNSTLETAI